MGIIENKRKFKPNKKQSNPANPTGNTNIEIKKFNIDEKTICMSVNIPKFNKILYI
jgi:hypothetical protein